MRFSDSTTWLAIGASALATVAVLTAVAVALRVRRGDRSRTEEERPDESEHVWEEVRRRRAETARARSELQWLHRLAGASGSLDSVLRQALEAAADVADAGAAMLLLTQPGGEPLSA
ncbi:MAG: hypothetical protein ACREJR_07980, partial [Candidatus Rokuibacteriota bacterium]